MQQPLHRERQPVLSVGNGSSRRYHINVRPLIWRIVTDHVPTGYYLRRRSRGTKVQDKKGGNDRAWAFYFLGPMDRPAITSCFSTTCISDGVPHHYQQNIAHSEDQGSLAHSGPSKEPPRWPHHTWAVYSAIRSLQLESLAVAACCSHPWQLTSLSSFHHYHFCG